MQERECFLPASQVKQRYGVTDMSIWRWLKDESLGFPQPIENQRPTLLEARGLASLGRCSRRKQLSRPQLALRTARIRKR